MNFSPNLISILFASALVFCFRRESRVITENDQKEAGDILDLLMEEDAGHC